MFPSLSTRISALNPLQVVPVGLGTQPHCATLGNHEWQSITKLHYSAICIVLQQSRDLLQCISLCSVNFLRRPTAELSDSQLQLQLLNVLLQEQTSLRSQGVANQSAGAVQRPGCLPPAPPRLPTRDMPATSMNRDQLLQELFKLELDCQDPQV